jgi:hypothetical protein
MIEWVAGGALALYLLAKRRKGVGAGGGGSGSGGSSGGGSSGGSGGGSSSGGSSGSGGGSSGGGSSGDGSIPKGGITDEERAAADQALAQKPNAVDTSIVPAPKNVRPANKTDEDWYASVAYWTVYRNPTGAWVQAGRTPAPVTIPSASSPWALRWNQIRTYIAAKLQPVNTPPQGPLTNTERGTADLILLGKPQSVEASIVPPPDNVREAGDEADDWYTTVTYWTVWRSPGSEWVLAGNLPAPVKIPSASSPWAKRWNEIHTYVVGKLAPNKPQPSTSPTITSLEQSAADFAWLVKPTKVENAAEMGIPPEKAQKSANKSWAEWLATFVYWGVYRSATSDWVKNGGDPAPVSIPSPASPWAKRWNAIYQYLQGKV